MPEFDKPENATRNECGVEPAPADEVVLVYMTFPDRSAAELAGEALVEGGVAACVNIIGGMVSIYRWQGEIQRDQEVVMIVKTRRAMAEAAMAAVRARHPYENPAMLIVPVIGGAQPYLDWLASETRNSDTRGAETLARGPSEAGQGEGLTPIPTAAKPTADGRPGSVGRPVRPREEIVVHRTDARRL